MNSIAVFVVIVFFAGSVVFDASKLYNADLPMIMWFCQNADSQRVSLGSFRRINHQIAGNLFAIDEKTIRIENFQYDGTGVSKLLCTFFVLSV